MFLKEIVDPTLRNAFTATSTLTLETELLPRRNDEEPRRCLYARTSTRRYVVALVLENKMRSQSYSSTRIHSSLPSPSMCVSPSNVCVNARNK